MSLNHLTNRTSFDERSIDLLMESRTVGVSTNGRVSERVYATGRACACLRLHAPVFYGALNKLIKDKLRVSSTRCAVYVRGQKIQEQTLAETAFFPVVCVSLFATYARNRAFFALCLWIWADVRQTEREGCAGISFYQRMMLVLIICMYVVPPAFLTAQSLLYLFTEADEKAPHL